MPARTTHPERGPSKHVTVFKVGSLPYDEVLIPPPCSTDGQTEYFASTYRPVEGAGGLARSQKTASTLRTEPPALPRPASVVFMPQEGACRPGWGCGLLLPARNTTECLHRQPGHSFQGTHSPEGVNHRSKLTLTRVWEAGGARPGHRCSQALSSETDCVASQIRDLDGVSVPPM